VAGEESGRPMIIINAAAGDPSVRKMGSGFSSHGFKSIY